MRNRMVGSASAVAVIMAVLVVPAHGVGAEDTADRSPRAADRALDRALEQLVTMPGGPPV